MDIIVNINWNNLLIRIARKTYIRYYKLIYKKLLKHHSHQLLKLLSNKKKSTK
jgi:hypothetical protein